MRASEAVLRLCNRRRVGRVDARRHESRPPGRSSRSSRPPRPRARRAASPTSSFATGSSSTNGSPIGAIAPDEPWRSRRPRTRGPPDAGPARPVRLPPAPRRRDRGGHLLRARRRDRRLAWPATSTHTAPTTPQRKASRPRTSLQAHGYRETAVIVLVDGRADREPATRSRVEGIERQLRRRDDVSSSRATTTRVRAPSFRGTATKTYLAVALRAHRRQGLQDAARASRISSSRRAGRTVGGGAVAKRRSTSRSSTTCAGPRCSPSRSSSCSRCCSSAASSPRCCHC